MKNLITPTAIFLTALILTFSSVSYFKTQPSVGIALPQAVGVFETSLQTGITSTATTMTLTANSIRGGGSLSGFNCFSADEGNSNAEVICGTVSGTTVSGLTRGISYEDGETEVSGNKYSHRRGANIKITDFPIIQRLKAQNNGDSTFVNQLQYESYLTPTDDADIISKKYADDLAIAGSPDASLTVKGLVEMSSQAGMASTSVAGTGDTTAWLALSATYATSTPTIRGLYVPVSENDGYLSQLWTRLSDAYTWTGAHIFSSTVNISGATTLTGLFSSSATSTMATTTVTKLTASADTANPIYLNGIDYSFPATESASSTVLSTDGSGSLSWKEDDNSIETCSGTVSIPSSGSGNSGTAYGTCSFTVSKLDIIVDGDGVDGWWTWVSGKNLIFTGSGVSTSNIDWDSGADASTIIGVGTATSTGFSMTWSHSVTYGGDAATVNFIGTK